MPEVQHLNVKLFANNPETIELEKFIPIFHNWIRVKALSSEILIDVADYTHIPSGPGILLIGHDSFYSIDFGPENKIGLLYNRRTVFNNADADANGGDLGTNKKCIISALEKTLHVKNLLESEDIWKKQLSFATNTIKFTINDRYIAPNEEATFMALKDDFQAAIAKTFKKQSGIHLYYNQEDVRNRFSLTATIE